LNNLAPEIRRGCLNYLRKICGDQALLPRSLAIPLCCNLKENPVYRGRYSDMWVGEHNGKGVAAKVVKVYSFTNLGEIRKAGCWWFS